MPAPPEGHPRQCHARSQRTRRRCRRWALVGVDYCQFHGGRRALYYKTGKKRLPTFYSKYLGPKLKKRVEELLKTPHDEQVSLYEELALARSMACEALALAAPVFENGNDLTPETRAKAVQVLGAALENVKDLVLAASRLEKDSADKVSLKVLHLVVPYTLILADPMWKEREIIAKFLANRFERHGFKRRMVTANCR